MTKPVISTPISRKHPFSPLKMSRMAANGFMLKAKAKGTTIANLLDDIAQDTEEPPTRVRIWDTNCSSNPINKSISIRVGIQFTMSCEQ